MVPATGTPISLSTLAPPGQGQHAEIRGPVAMDARVPDHERTTIMLRNIPNDYTRDMLLELLDSEGLASLYDFVYLPSDFKRWQGLGYAFVNMVSHEDAVF